jgi:hypothetical protein
MHLKEFYGILHYRTAFWYKIFKLFVFEILFSLSYSLQTLCVDMLLNPFIYQLALGQCGSWPVGSVWRGLSQKFRAHRNTVYQSRVNICTGFKHGDCKMSYILNFAWGTHIHIIHIYLEREIYVYKWTGLKKTNNTVKIFQTVFRLYICIYKFLELSDRTFSINRLIFRSNTR